MLMSEAVGRACKNAADGDESVRRAVGGDDPVHVGRYAGFDMQVDVGRKVVAELQSCVAHRTC